MCFCFFELGPRNGIFSAVSSESPRFNQRVLHPLTIREVLGWVEFLKSTAGEILLYCILYQLYHYYYYYYYCYYYYYYYHHYYAILHYIIL